MKNFISILSLMLIFGTAFGGVFDSDAMSKLGQELNVGLEEIKEESEWDKKEKKAKADMEYKEQIRQAKIALQRDMENFIRQHSATIAVSDFYRENYIHKTPACEFNLYYMETGNKGNRLFYRCPVKVPLSRYKEVQDYRLIGKESSYDSILYILSSSADYRKGVGVNFTFPPEHRQANCLGYSFFFFENPKEDLKKNNAQAVSLEFIKLKTWKIDDYIEDSNFVCEEGR